LGDSASNVALGQNTHELLTRWLSALSWRERPRLVTTDAEFHTIRRQIDRLAEEGLPVVKIAARPVDTLADRMAAAVDDTTAGVMVSSVFFDTAEIVPGLDRVAAACDASGTRLLIDAYHHLNVVPFDLYAMGLERAFVTGGGYKYCQLGEGNCFLRVPPDCDLRPVLTGWFAEFAERATRDDREGHRVARVAYAPGAGAFAGATYDPTSHYRAAAVFAFHRQHGLTPERLREISRRQVGLLRSAFDRHGIDPHKARVVPMPEERRGGFLAISTPSARDLAVALKRREVFADARGDILRLGPAPYLRDDQLQDAVARLAESLSALS
jgi:kynureninase